MKALVLVLACGCALAACSSHPVPTSPAAPSDAKPADPTGLLTREDILRAVPAWKDDIAASSPNAEAVRALGRVPPGAEVEIYLGTWCGDSRREVSRFLRALDEAGGSFPFAVRLIGVDGDKEEPKDLLLGKNILYVPTIIVRRGGREVGRIVETSPRSIEQDLLALLDGSQHGILTASRPELIEAP